MVRELLPEPDAAKRRRKRWATNVKDQLKFNKTVEREPASPKQLHAAVQAELHRLALAAGEDPEDKKWKISQAAVYMWLDGTTSPSYEKQAIVARVLGVPHHSLFTLEATA